MPELTLEHTKRMPDLGSHAGLECFKAIRDLAYGGCLSNVRRFCLDSAATPICAFIPKCH